MQDKYLWVKQQMPLIYDLGKKLPKTNRRFLISLPLTWETLCLVDAIRNKIQLSVIPLTSGSNSSLQPLVFSYLKKWQIPHWEEASQSNRLAALRQKPDIILDCIFTISALGLKHKLIPQSTLLIEDTRTGSINLKQALKKYGFKNPFYILDDNRYKRLYENRIGIGYSVVGSLIAHGILLKGQRITILGFGPVGQGLAEFSQGMGGIVQVVDPNPQRALQAQSKYLVEDLTNILKTTDIFITATGAKNVLTKEHLLQMRDGAILVNAGADYGEWDQDFLHHQQKISLGSNIVKFSLPNGKNLIELGGGNSFNLVSSISVSPFLDVTFSLAILAINEFISGADQQSGQLSLPQSVFDTIKNHTKTYLPDFSNLDNCL